MSGHDFVFVCLYVADVSIRLDIFIFDFNTVFTSSCFNIFSLYCLSLLQFFLGGGWGFGVGVVC